MVDGASVTVVVADAIADPLLFHIAVAAVIVVLGGGGTSAVVETRNA